MAVITIDLPEEIYATLRRSPRELERDLRLAAAIDWYRLGFISPGRGAEVAGLPRADFIDALAARKIEVAQGGSADWSWRRGSEWLLQRDIAATRMAGLPMPGN